MNNLNEKGLGMLLGKNEISETLKKAQNAFNTWAFSTFEERFGYLLAFQNILKEEKEKLSLEISKEIGKILWESKAEVDSVINKVDLSLNSYLQRTPYSINKAKEQTFLLKHRAHGVVAVIGPFNLPLYLPASQIIPALLAGNCVVFKPSSKAVKVAFFLKQLFDKAGLPPYVFNIILGNQNEVEILASSPDCDAIFFSGSSEAGQNLNKIMCSHPGKLLVLEMGGNNPLVVWDSKDISAAVYTTLISAFLTSGQRLTSAKRLILPKNTFSKKFLEHLCASIKKINVGFFDSNPQPFMGPVVSSEVQDSLFKKEKLLLSLGAKSLIALRSEMRNLVYPGLIDITLIDPQLRPDSEYFGPLLQVIEVDNFEKAIEEAKNTQYGLVASILTEDKSLYKQFYLTIKAGLIHWNTPTTGATGFAPFGGVGKSGNFRPGGFYMADSCAYPVVSFENDKLSIPSNPLPGVCF
jgi:succinylglutamic semialdehyde dehydrogenase